MFSLHALYTLEVIWATVLWGFRISLESINGSLDSLLDALQIVAKSSGGFFSPSHSSYRGQNMLDNDSW